MIGIYKITSPTNKIYIGQSTDIQKRFDTYKILACRSQRKLYNSLKKYGVEQHQFEILEECLFEDLNIRERYYQELYNVLSNKGLNLILTSTDKLKKKMSRETRSKISRSKSGTTHTLKSKELMSLNNSRFWKNKRFTLEHRQKLSLKKKERIGKDNPRYGTLHSLESKLKMSRSRSKKVINIETGEIFNSAKEAALSIDSIYGTLINKLSGARTNNTVLKYYDISSTED